MEGLVPQISVFLYYFLLGKVFITDMIDMNTISYINVTVMVVTLGFKNDSFFLVENVRD